MKGASVLHLQSQHTRSIIASVMEHSAGSSSGKCDPAGLRVLAPRRY